MGLAAVFKLSIYILTGFVGVVLGAAEHGFIPFVSLPVTIFAYWWCEVGADGQSHKRGMSETVARVLGFLALLAASFEFFSESEEGKLLAGIHLVVYLTWVVLLQQKSNYRYWLLLTLGMMHIAVGAVLTSSTWYGLCMVIYLFGAIWTLSVFSLYRVAQEFAAIEPDVDTREAAVHAAARISPMQGQVFNDVCLEDNASWISMRLVSGVILTSVAGLLVGGMFFALIPRVWVGAALGISDDSLPAALRNRAVTGQMTEVRLGDLGQILESNDPVLTIQLFEHRSNRRIHPQIYAESLGLREPLFRGAVLTDYSGGRWRPERAWSAATTRVPAEPEPNLATVRQEIRLERIGTDTLFCVGRTVAMRDADGYRVGLMQPTSALVVRRTWFESLPGAVEYTAYSQLTTSQDRQDPGLVPSKPELVTYRMSGYVQRCQEFPSTLSRLGALAREVRETAEKQAGKRLTDTESARAIEAYLRDSGTFAYSLTAGAVDETMDPVEDFVFNRRAGHCQYFASALALMLRSVGIPARLVSGFKGGEELPDGTLNVEKRYAHVWVEAWIEDRKWMTFDATPEDGRDESVTEIGSKKTLFSMLKSKLTGIWESNILEVSYERQDDLIYQPLRESMDSLVKFSRDFWQSPRTALIGILVFIVDPRNWLTLPGGLMLSLLAGLLWLLRRKTSWFRWSWNWRRRESTESQLRRIEFYERFAALMQSQGQTREPTQTQQEFVSAMAANLSDRLADASLDSEVQSIASLFYRVRFGDGQLTTLEISQLNALLTRLERALSQQTARRAQPA